MSSRERHTLRCACQNQRGDWGWDTVKPLAPAAIAAEREYGDAVDVLAIDVESEARAAYERRRADELEYQAGLEAFASQ